MGKPTPLIRARRSALAAGWDDPQVAALVQTVFCDSSALISLLLAGADAVTPSPALAALVQALAADRWAGKAAQQVLGHWARH